MMQVAERMRIDLEAVPIAEFVPLPVDADKRVILVGQFGNLTVHVFDPYTIALSKLDRGFDIDLEDILFLVQHKLVSVDQLAAFVEESALQAREFDLDPVGMRRHLQVVRQSLQR